MFIIPFSFKHWKMELVTLENGIGNIGKWDWEPENDNLMIDETLENGNNGKCNWEMHFEIGIRNWQWKHWKFVFKT